VLKGCGWSRWGGRRGAWNVCALEIVDERSTEPQRVLRMAAGKEGADDDEVELGMHVRQVRWLIVALREMTALRRFVWSCNDSPMSVDNARPTLLECCLLEEVKINDNLA
jgi:hypothetical protein